MEEMKNKDFERPIDPLTKVVKLSIMGEPKGKGRPRFCNRGSFVKTYSDKETTSYENLVKTVYANKYGFKVFNNPDKPLMATIMCFFSIPKSVSKKKRQQMLDGNIIPTKKPDTDNIAKIILDSLNKIAYDDDSQISVLIVCKLYSETPRVELLIKEYNYEGELD